jgi:hypothetical protein
MNSLGRGDSPDVACISLFHRPLDIVNYTHQNDFAEFILQIRARTAPPSVRLIVKKPVSHITN